MRRASLLLMLAFWPTAGSAAPLSDFGWFAGLLDACWEGRFPDGETVHRQCYRSQYGHFMRGTAELGKDAGAGLEVQFEGDSIFAWNAAAGAIDYSIWGANGSYSHHRAHYVGDELHFPIASKEDADRVAYRSVWRQIDADRFEVRREVPDGDGWKVELRVEYRRVAR